MPLLIPSTRSSSSWNRASQPPACALFISRSMSTFISSKLTDRIFSPGTQEKKSSHSVNCAVLLSRIDGSMPSEFKYFKSLPTMIDRFCSSLGSGSGSFLAISFASIFPSSMLVGRPVSGFETLTSGISGTSGFGSGTFSGSGRGGAGTTAVIPSGSLFCLLAALRSFSPAPPARGLKALALPAAFQRAAASLFSPAFFPFLALIMGPRPGRCSSSGDVGESTGVSVGDAEEIGMTGLSAVGSAAGRGGGLVSTGGGCSTGAEAISSNCGVGSVFCDRCDGLRGDIRSMLLGGGATGDFGSTNSRDGSRDCSRR